MTELIPISTLNDFIFCPYSIYLHNVYMDTDEGNYHAIPQTRGKNAHSKVDSKSTSTSADIIESLPVISHELGVYGKIDIYKKISHSLIERKYQLKNIYQGQIYQLWAQYFCMIEMGYAIKNLSFFEISTHRTIRMEIPNDKDKSLLMGFLDSYRNYNPTGEMVTNHNKCSHCVYCNLCDKTINDNVYT